MSSTAAPADVETPSLLTFSVDGSWSVHDLVTLLTAVGRIYDAFAAASIAGSTFSGSFNLGLLASFKDPGLTYQETAEMVIREAEEEPETAPDAGERPERAWFSVTPSMYGSGKSHFLHARPSGARLLEPVMDNLQALMPGGGLQIHRIQIASPGEISLKGSGEPIEETRKLIESLTTLNQTRKQAQLQTDQLRIEVERSAREETRDAQLDEIAVARERLGLIEEILKLRFGPDFREVEGIDRLIGKLLSGTADIQQLLTTPHLLLESGSSAA